MRRRISIASCLIVLCIGAVVLLWCYGLRPKQGEAAGLEENVRNEQLHKEAALSAAKRAKDMRVFALPTRIAFFDKDQFSPCYVDLESHILYRWKGVIFQREQLSPAYTGSYSQLRMCRAKDFTVELIEAPVKYMETNGKFHPAISIVPAGRSTSGRALC